MTDEQRIHTPLTGQSKIAFDRLREAIMSGTLAPGMRIPLAMLSDQLEIGTMPIRDALVLLRGMGLVEPLGQGLRVVAPSPALIRDVYEKRSGLESMSSWAAATRADAADRRMILTTALRSLDWARAGDAALHSRWSMAFHRAVAQAGGNNLLANAISDVLTLGVTLRSQRVNPAEYLVLCGQEHVAIAQAILRRDALDSMRLTVDHDSALLARIQEM